jgi:type VI protein secretion system component VasF
MERATDQLLPSQSRAKEIRMEIVMISVAAITCVFYVYAFVKFAMELDARESLDQRRLTQILPLKTLV